MKHLGDITKINGAEIEPVDVVCAGSPCGVSQDQTLFVWRETDADHHISEKIDEVHKHTNRQFRSVLCVRRKSG